MRFSVLLPVLLTALPALAQEAPPPPPYVMSTMLQISAEATAHGAPDLATISTGVQTDAKTAADAMRENAVRMSKVVEALKKSGVPDKDIQTMGLNLSAQYQYGENQPPQVTGYQAMNTVSVVLHGMDKIGPTLDALVAEGANQINGPVFSIENPDRLLDAARAEAVGKAKARAELYARAVGLKVKRIVAISEGVAAGPPVGIPMMKMQAMGAEAVSTPVESGQLELKVDVHMTFELE